MKTNKSSALLFILFSFLLSAMLSWFLQGRWLSFAELQRELLAIIDAVINELIIGDEKGALNDVVPLAIGELQPEIHGAEFQCFSKNATGIEDLPKGKIYRWLDEAGGVHYGDRPPPDAAVDIVDVGYTEKDYFSLQVHYPAGSVPADIRDTIAIGGKAVYRVYSGYLSLPRMSRSSIEVKIFGNEGSYIAYRQKVAPDVPASTNGFYSWARNEAVVFHGGSAVDTRQTALHEATHVINARNFGVMPKWFNEGTAEFFEHLKISGQQITVDFDTGWLRGLGREYGLLPLHKVLGSSRRDWDGDLRSTYYANAWALVYFLMLPENRVLMQAFQLELAANKCDDIDSAAFFERQYPGGVVRLEQRWRRWLTGPHRVATRF